MSRPENPDGLMLKFEELLPGDNLPCLNCCLSRGPPGSCIVGVAVYSGCKRDVPVRFVPDVEGDWSIPWGTGELPVHSGLSIVLYCRAKWTGHLTLTEYARGECPMLVLPDAWSGGAVKPFVCTADWGWYYYLANTVPPRILLGEGRRVPSLQALSRFSFGEGRLTQLPPMIIPDQLRRVKYYRLRLSTNYHGLQSQVSTVGSSNWVS